MRFILAILLITLVGCVADKGKVDVKGLKGPPSVSGASLSADRKKITITGKNLENVTSVTITSPVAHTFDIDSKSSGQLVISPSSALSLTAGILYNFVVSDAKGSAAFSIDFNLPQGGANVGDILQWDGVQWARVAMPSSGLSFQGQWSVTGAQAWGTDGCEIISGGLNGCTAPSAGFYYIASDPGTLTIDGAFSWGAGDWIVFDDVGNKWNKIDNSASNFTPANGDYDWNMIANSPSGGFDYRPDNVACSNGELLKYNAAASRWECGVDTATSADPSSTGDYVIGADSDSSAAGEIQFNIGGTTHARITNAGDLKMGADIGTGVGQTFSIGEAGAPATILLGEDSNNKGMMSWSPAGDYFSLGSTVGGTPYNDVIVIKNGNVGIRKVPSYPLDIDANIRISGAASNSFLYSPAGTTGGTAMNFGGGTIGLGNSSANLVLINSSNGTNNGNLLNVQEGGVTRFKVQQEGTVTVGETSSSGTLSINGNIHAEQICDETGNNCKDISTGWSGGSVGDNSATGSVTLNADNDGNGDGALLFQIAGATQGMLSSNGVFAMGATPIDAQYKVLLKGTAPSQSALNLRMDKGIDDITFNRIIGFTNEAFSLQYGYFDVSNNSFRLGSGNTMNLIVSPNQPTSHLKLHTAGGNVAIGDITPTALLHLDKASGSTIKLGSSNALSNAIIEDVGTNTGSLVLMARPTGAAKGGIQFAADNNIQFLDRAMTTTKFIVEPTGDVGVGDVTPDSHLEVSADGTTGGAILMLSSNDDNDGDILTVLENGKVGIGTTTPAGKLSVKDNLETFSAFGRTGVNRQWNFGLTGGAATWGAVYNFFDMDATDASRTNTQVSLFNINTENSIGNTSRVDLGVKSDGSGYLYANASGTDPQRDLHLGVAGTPVITVDSTKQVGIGTITPTATLYVTGAGYAGMVAGERTDMATVSSLIGLDSSVSDVYMQNDSGEFILYNGGTIGSNVGAERLRMKTDGRIGIGTSAPDSNFDVAGNIKLNSANGVLYIGDRPGISTGTIHMIGNASSTGYHVSGSEAGDLTIGAKGGENIQLGTNSVFEAIPISRVTIASNGNVGIGTTSPTAKLDVIGGIKVGSPTGTNDGMIGYFNSDLYARTGGTWKNLTATPASIFTEISGVVKQNAPDFDEDFVFGSTQLADTGNALHDNRFFFDKSKGAFRAGGTIDTQWDDANVGNFSVALGSRGIASGTNSVVSGGVLGVASGSYSVVAGGQMNTASGFEASVGGGRQNQANGQSSWVAGRRAINSSAHSGSFMFADASDFNFNSAAANEFAVRAQGGFRFVTAIDGSGNPTESTVVSASGKVGIGNTAPAAKLDVAGGIKMANDADACDATKEGTMRYNSTTKKMQYCNATAWTDLAAPTTPTLTCQCNSATGTTVGTGVSVATATLAAGYTRTGGGCRETATNSRLLIENYPISTNQWYCESTDHNVAFGGRVDAYVCGCKIP